MLKLMEGINAMSAGTMASLTGLKTYDAIYEEKAKFREFASKLDQELTWQEAWHLYQEKRGL